MRKNITYQKAIDASWLRRIWYRQSLILRNWAQRFFSRIANLQPVAISLKFLISKDIGWRIRRCILCFSLLIQSNRGRFSIATLSGKFRPVNLMLITGSSTSRNLRARKNSCSSYKKGEYRHYNYINFAAKAVPRKSHSGTWLANARNYLVSMKERRKLYLARSNAYLTQKSAFS